VVILEGSGSAVPPVPWDAGVLVAPAHVPEEYVGGYLGPFRILLSDLFVVTMASGPGSGPEKLFALESHVQRLNGDARFVVTDFQPAPLRDVRGRAVYFTTTAPEEVAARQVAHLESTHGCRVVGHSTRLADRAALAEDLERSDHYDVLLTELKAAAVDVAADRATARGAEVVFVDNRAVTLSDGPDLRTSLQETLDRAVARHGARTAALAERGQDQRE